jgi:hypothetical protein
LQWTGKPGTLTVAEFLQAWGDTVAAPVQALRMTPEAPRPTLTVTAATPRVQAEEQIEWSLGPDHASGQFRLTSQNSALPNHFRCQLPAQWNVRRIDVQQGDATVPARWLRHADGTLSILLNEVRTGPWQLELTADKSHASGKPTTLPVLLSPELDITRYECLLRQRPGAIVTLGKTAAWKSIAAEPAALAISSERQIARLEWSPPRPNTTPPALPITIAPAWSRATGQLLTRLRSGETGWRVEVLAQLYAPGETFDELQFSVPRDWPDSVDLDPPGQSQVEPLPGQSRNLLRVRLAQPAKDQLTLRMSTGVMEELELVHLPAVDLFGLHELQRWVSLPKTDRGSRLQWQLAGLQPRSDLPPMLASESSGEELIYEAIIDRYRAIARPERARQELPRVVLANHEVVWQTDRRIVGRTELTILPGGARSVLIQPPDAHELIAVVVNDVPATLRREPGISGAASVELHSDSWPQWVQIVYRGRLPTGGVQGASWEFAAPRIAGAPVDRTRWLIAGPERLLPDAAASNPLPAADDLLAPLEALAKVARGAGEVPGGNLAESTDAWLRIWRRHWDREYGAVNKLGGAALREPATAARLATIQADLGDLLTTPVIEDGADRAATEHELSPFTEVAAVRPVYDIRTVQPGDLSTWKVQLASAQAAPVERWNWIAALGLIGSAALLTQAGRSAALRDWLAAHPQLTLALAGCGALLVPGYLWLGLLILSLTLLITLHSPWRQRA